MTERIRYSSGSPWEPVVGYCRAVKVGNIIHVAGTTAVSDGIVCYPDDAYKQTIYILEIIRKALNELGAGMQHVVRTRMYVTDISRWEEFGRAHGEIFSDIRPAATMIEVSRLIDPQMLVEIEVEAVAD
jgi:enamine deaminase RidA (YjgF/YER057c/UK114 family)